MSQKSTNKNDKKIYALPEGSLPVRPKSFFNFLPKQQPLIDTGYESDETVIIDEPYGPEETSGILNMKLTDVNSSPTNDKIYFSPPATELLTRDGKRMFYKINDKMEPVTNDNYNRDMVVYDQNGNEIPRGEHLPENRIFMNDIMEEPTGGKKKRKIHRKTMRKTKRKKTRRYRRRHTRKYK